MDTNERKKTEGPEKPDTSVAGKIKEKIARRKRLVMRELELKRLKRLRKKTRPAYTYCKNCGTELKGMYCHKCGQYALDVEQPFWKYIKQYFENVYQFDSKVWSTLWLLFRRPGFLTNEFNAGKIASYVHPLRLLMFITVLFFLFLFLKLGNEVQSLQEKDMDNLTENLSEGLTDFASEMNIYGEDWYRIADSTGIGDNTATISIVADSTFLAKYPQMFEIVECSPAADPENAGMDTLAVRIKIPEDILTEYGYAPDDTWRGLPLYKSARVNSSNSKLDIVDDFLGYASKWIPIMVLLLSPVMASICRFMYRKTGISYMGNFVYVLHLHSFFFIVMSAFLIVGSYLPSQPDIWMKLLTWTLILYTLYYTTLSSHRVYKGTGWIKCTVKSLLMWISFLFILAVALIILTILIAARLES